MEADDVKLGLKVVLFAGVLLLLRAAVGIGHAGDSARARTMRPVDASDVMLRLDAARRPPRWASAE